MTYSEDKDSAIDSVIQSLERVHQLKKKEFKNRKAYQNSFAGSHFFPQSLDPLSAPILQIQSVLKISEEVLKFVSEKMQQEIKQNPWALLGKVAMGSFVVGLIMARRLTF